MANKSPHMPNTGLRAIARAEWQAKQAANRAKAPGTMAAIYAASTRKDGE